MSKYKTTIDTFNKLAQQYQDKYLDADIYHPSYQELLHYVPKNTAKVLDIGCGPGNISCYLQSKLPALNITGIDPAPKMIALAKQNLPQATFLVMDARDIHVIEELFDVIICGFCLPYLSQNDSAVLIGNCAKLLAPKGVLYLSTMEGDYAGSGYDSNAKGDQVYTHFHSGQSLKQCLNDNGLEVKVENRQAFTRDDGRVHTDLFLIAQG